MHANRVMHEWHPFCIIVYLNLLVNEAILPLHLYFSHPLRLHSQFTFHSRVNYIINRYTRNDYIERELPQKIELVRNKNYVTWRDRFRVENSVTADDTFSLYCFASFYCYWLVGSLAVWHCCGGKWTCSIDANKVCTRRRLPVIIMCFTSIFIFIFFLFWRFEWRRKVAVAEIIQSEPVFQWENRKGKLLYWFVVKRKIGIHNEHFLDFNRSLHAIASILFSSQCLKTEFEMADTLSRILQKAPARHWLRWCDGIRFWIENDVIKSC